MCEGGGRVGWCVSVGVGVMYVWGARCEDVTFAFYL